MSLVTLIASHVLQHVQLSRSHYPFLARFSPFLPHSNSARLLRLLCPASLAMDLQRMVAEKQNNPAFPQEIIRMLAQTQSDAGSAHPEGASNAPGPSNTDLLDFSDPHVAPTPEHASATVEPKCKAKPASLLRPDPPELPEDCIPTHAPEVKESVPLEPASEENSMPEPPHVRAPWAQLTEEEREEQLAREEQPEHPWHDRIDGTPDALRRNRIDPEPKPAAEPEPGPTPCMYKAPPTGAKFPACRQLDTPHNWPPQEGDPCHQPPLHGFPWSHDGSYWANYWHLGGVPDEAARWHPATSTDPAYAANQRIAAYSVQHSGNPGAGSRPTPLPEMPKRQQRAAFVQQLEACIRIPSLRLPRTMRRMEMQGRGLRMLYLDDNNRISCCLPCANSACPATDTHDRHRCSGCVADARDLNR